MKIRSFLVASLFLLVSQPSVAVEIARAYVEGSEVVLDIRFMGTGHTQFWVEPISERFVSGLNRYTYRLQQSVREPSHGATKPMRVSVSFNPGPGPAVVNIEDDIGKVTTVRY